MSHDLYFAQKMEAKQISAKEFEEYFSKRKNYSCEENEVVYSNDDTGVYFCFGISPDECAEDNEDKEELRNALLNKGLKQVDVSFNINYARPHIFGLEAAPELLDFTDHFGLSVIDEQIDGVGIAQYTTEGFLRSWMKSNFSAGYQMMLQISEEEPTDILTLPTDKIERHWCWNLALASLRDRLTEDIFAPTIMYIRHNGRVRSFCVWPDTIPILLPKVDAVLLYLDEIAPKKLFGKRKTGFALIDFEKLEQLSSILVRGETDGIYYRIDRQKDPELISFFRAQPYINGELEKVTVDNVLNKEQFEEAKKLRNKT